MAAVSAVICVPLLTISCLPKPVHPGAVLEKQSKIGSFIRMESIHAQNRNSSVMQYIARLDNAYYSSNYNYLHETLIHTNTRFTKSNYPPAPVYFFISTLKRL